MDSIALGVYIHIPYCLQICPYCDFTKYELGKILPPEKYISLLIQEIKAKSPAITKRKLNTIYFGGGTPSLLEPSLILSVIDALANEGFIRGESQTSSDGFKTEVTIEIDPATVDERKLDLYLDMGVTRFSVGAQTFNERLLKIAGRKHSSQDTVNLLTLLKDRGVNYSFDLLFALPTQTLEELRADIATALAFAPSHISAYCLTVPESHPMAKNRAPDEEQTEMFALIESALAAKNLARYEISNFAKPGFESQHNQLYWTDQAYWGLGVSSHSYFPPKFQNTLDKSAPWGTRFWNATTLLQYEKDIAKWAELSSWDLLRDTPEDRIEILELHQSLTDFCHTSLRLKRGLSENALRLKFGTPILNRTREELDKLIANNLVQKTADGWTMTDQGRLLANLVFEKLTFLPRELTTFNPNS